MAIALVAVPSAPRLFVPKLQRLIEKRKNGENFTRILTTNTYECNRGSADMSD